MNIARIVNGLVVNIEIADQEWIDANQGVDGCTFVPYTDVNVAHIGLGWNETDGFEQPNSIPFEVTP